MTGRAYFHLNSPVGPVLGAVRGAIGKCVLFTDIMRNSFTKRSNFRQALREKSLTTRSLGKPSESSGILVGIFGSIYTDGVDDGVGFLRYG